MEGLKAGHSLSLLMMLVLGMGSFNCSGSLLCNEPFGPTGGLQTNLLDTAPTGTGFATGWAASSSDGSDGVFTRTDLRLRRPVHGSDGASRHEHCRPTALAGYRYLLQRTTNLGASTSWVTLSNLPPAFTDCSFTFGDVFTNPAAFYRTVMTNQ